MPTMKVEPAQSLDWKQLKQICASAGPCITILLPAYHPGAQSLSYAVRLKSAIQAAEQQLLKFSPPGEIEELLAPLCDLTGDPDMTAGGRDMALFRAPGVMSRFYTPAAVKETVAAGWHFYVLPLVGMLTEEREFYVLGVGQKALRLLLYRDGRCQEVPMPASIPKSMEEAGGFDQPDHTLENRSTAGKSAGAIAGVYFGTGSERETAGERLHYFFRMVDKGLHHVLRGRLLVLAGAEHEVAAYRRAATYSRVAGGQLAGDVRLFPIGKIQQIAVNYARSVANHDAEEAMRELREQPGRVARDLAMIADAAGQGRVAKLILAEGAASSADDLLNTSAVLTIKNGGEVFLLPADRMAGEGQAAAIFRY